MSMVSGFHRPDPALLTELRARIRCLEGRAEEDAGSGLPFGIQTLDAVLPEGGLERGALHAITGGARAGDGAASGFAAALLARLAGPAGTVLWCRRDADLYGPGLGAFGLSADRLVVVHPRSSTDVLWAMEEGLRSGVLSAVLGEPGCVPPVAARRLQLAAEAGRTTALLLSPGGDSSPLPSATRWRISAVPSASPYPGLGPPRWRVELLRCRGGRAGTWILEWRENDDRNGEHETTGGFTLVAGFPHRSATSPVGDHGTPQRHAAPVRLAG